MSDQTQNALSLLRFYLNRAESRLSCDSRSHDPGEISALRAAVKEVEAWTEIQEMADAACVPAITPEEKRTEAESKETVDRCMLNVIERQHPHLIDELPRIKRLLSEHDGQPESATSRPGNKI